MGGLVAAFRKIYQVEHIGCESESVAELLDEYAYIYRKQRWSVGVAEIYECQAGERHGPCHWPQPFFQTSACGHYTECKPYYAYGSIDESDLACAESESANVDRVEQEWIDKFHELGFGQAIEQHERDGYPYLLFAEETAERVEEFLEYVSGASSGIVAGVGAWTRERPAVVGCHGEEECRQYAEYDHPCHRYIS